jgi:choline dehydrogenase
MRRKNFDFIVIGAGSAGSAVAARLSEHAEAQVLVLEAGGKEVPDAARNPSIWYTLLGSSIDWGYASVPQAGLAGRSTYEPRGKVIGGSSQLYIMMHIRGHRADFDAWAYGGAPGWSYEQVLPYFQRLEGQEDRSSPLAGHDGPLSVINAGNHDHHPLSRAFIDGCKALGYPETADFNGPQMEGVGWHHVNVKDGQRHSMADAYLLPALQRKNLTLEADAQVTRLLIEAGRCVGVEYVKGGKLHVVKARHEVVLSAGAIESPHLLLNSGIGPAAQLASHGVPVVVDLPGVGENFHNHVLMGMIAETREPVAPGRLNTSEAALFTRSHPGYVAPDLQINFVHLPFDVIVGANNPNSVSLIAGLQRPHSRGWLRLASGDPLARPLINPNYLAEEHDVLRMMQMVDIGREIYASAPMQSVLTGRELLPGPDVRTRAEIRDFVVRRSDSYHHQAGSCKMGTDAMAVVDPTLRVRGVEGLSVADASVMPAVVTGNPHTAIVMIGERAADFVAARHGLTPAVGS